MLLVELAFNLLMRADAGVSTIASDRVYLGFAPQTATYPLLVMRTENREHFIAIDGPCGLRQTRMRVFSAAKTYAEAKELDEAVRLAVQGFEGIISDETSPPNTLPVQLIECEFSHDMYEPGTKTHQIVTDYMITAHEEVPA